MIDNKKVVLAIDFNNVAYTSYYGQHLYNSKGMNVNAIKGFFFKLKSLIDVFDPDYIILANDLSREKTFRRKMYRPYKAQRKPTDPDIKTQMEYITKITALMGYPMLNNELYEADDVLGMISRLAQENDMETFIISSDKDLYQLVDDHVFVLSPRNNEVIDKYYLFDNFKLTPDQWIELKMLQGDRSDNIPGVPGIGHITALQLMNEFGSIENIYNNLKAIKSQKLRDVLANAHPDMELMRKLVTIITDYTKISLTKEMFEPKECFGSEVILTLNELEIPSLLPIFQYELIPRAIERNPSN